MKINPPSWRRTGAWIVAVLLTGAPMCAQNVPVPGAPMSPDLMPDGSPSDPSVIRVALVSDVHTDLSGKGNTVTYLPHFQTTIAQVNAAKVALVLISGDLVNSDSEAQWSDFKSRITAFKAPVRYVPGNHDVHNKLHSGKTDVVTSAAYANYVQSMGPGFFATEVAGLRLIGVTGSLFGSKLPEENQQWELLERTLGTRSALPTVVFCHYPLFVHTVDEPGGVYWNIEPEPRQRLLSLLRSGGVAAFLSGHLHRPLIHDEGSIALISAPAVAFGLPAGKQPEGWTLVTIPTSGIGPVRAYLHSVPH